MREYWFFFVTLLCGVLGLIILGSMDGGLYSPEAYLVAALFGTSFLAGVLSGFG